MKDDGEKRFAKLATWIIEKKVPPDPAIDPILKYFMDLKNTEENLSRSIVPWVAKMPIYEHYLKHIKGIGPILSANLIAMLTPIDRFPKPSMLVAYAGLAGQFYRMECANGHKIISSSPKASCPVLESNTDGEGRACGAPIVKSVLEKSIMRHEAGYHVFQNTRLKATLFKVATSFEKLSADKSQYRALYEAKKAEYASREGINKGHARMMALRYVEKRFLVNLHVVWMRGIGKEVTPYEATLPNHTIEPIRTDDGYPLPQPGSFEAVDDEASWAVKQLTDNYYDIQMMRIRAFNNIVAWLSTNRERLPEEYREFLKRKESEGDSED
ncbi:hypothetical protein DMB44_05335 [Thermoplasma sp. Kam2015]|uniref:transposase n=1 Tax=Thermoplasma sp. Kam2015 TaxID=2094122 RepID=UPI000D843226|nr:transposase [Thermoplasma sp. Kam2015]PYB68144.1 hypothetical protein DMB44_05335 [Thermoplasma sp. Kam2015]